MMKLVTIIGSGTNYGRTTRNNTLTEVLVFHQTLNTPKASYSGRYPLGTPQGRTQKIHIFPSDPITRTSYNTCPFHTSEFLKKYIITIPNTRVWNDKQRNVKKHLSIINKDSSMPTKRILHTMATPQAAPAIEVNKP